MLRQAHSIPCKNLYRKNTNFFSPYPSHIAKVCKCTLIPPNPIANPVNAKLTSLLALSSDVSPIEKSTKLKTKLSKMPEALKYESNNSVTIVANTLKEQINPMVEYALDTEYVITSITLGLSISKRRKLIISFSGKRFLTNKNTINADRI